MRFRVEVTEEDLAAGGWDALERAVRRAAGAGIDVRVSDGHLSVGGRSGRLPRVARGRLSQPIGFELELEDPHTLLARLGTGGTA
ncbi:MAG TPA: hypothetical protein VFD01_08030 [Candidatus Dormibacteraeota bacterium]|jgi:hypothetical protein|nr:hypothetical protein [Candidatus Dormibacteraeota bacterium]